MVDTIGLNKYSHLMSFRDPEGSIFVANLSGYRHILYIYLYI